MTTSRTSRAVLSAACLALVVPAAASAHGDLASEVLVAHDVFLPRDGSIPDAQGERLTELVAAAKRRGYATKVAVIRSDADLASLVSLWRRPQRYARFLGDELSFYDGRILVVMPNGYGIYRNGSRATAERRLLAALAAPGDEPAAITSAAATAIRRLAHAEGVAVAPSTNSSGGSETRDRLTIVAVVIVAGAVAGAVAFVRRRTRAA